MGYVYCIFDSLDRPCSAEVADDRLLFGSLQALQEEAEEEGDGLTYAIARRPVGMLDAWTFDF